MAKDGLGEEMVENITKIVTLMGVVGVPSIFTIALFGVREFKKYTNQLNILMKSQQAQMRSSLLSKYHQYIEDGWISEEELEDWENQYQSYHELGSNGVLDARRMQLFNLPNRKCE